MSDEVIELDPDVVEYVSSLSDIELSLVSNYIERESIKEMKNHYGKDDIRDIENKINKLVDEFIDRVIDEFNDYDAIVMIAVSYALKKSLSRKSILGASYLFDLDINDLMSLFTRSILDIFGKLPIVDKVGGAEYRIIKHDDNGDTNE